MTGLLSTISRHLGMSASYGVYGFDWMFWDLQLLRQWSYQATVPEGLLVKTTTSAMFRFG